MMRQKDKGKLHLLWSKDVDLAGQEFYRLRRKLTQKKDLTQKANPKRIQRMRTKDWKMPPNTVYVGRPSKWGNPWTIESALNSKFWHPEECAEVVVDEFEAWLNNDEYMSMDEHLGMWKRPEIQKQRAEILASLNELRGKNLACWCPLDQPCHADVLLKLANECVMEIIEETREVFDAFNLDRGLIGPKVIEGALHIYAVTGYDGYKSHVILNDDDLVCVLVGYWYFRKKKERVGGQFYRFFKNGVMLKSWKDLCEEDKLRILDQKLEPWMKKPGKLKKDYLKPHFHNKVETDNAGNIIAYKYLVWDETNEPAMFRSFSIYARNTDWVDNSMTADAIPSEDNTNGIYAAKTPNSPILNQYAKFAGVKLVRLLLSGVVLEFDYGYRAEQADIIDAMEVMA